jgi:hypothetical protein
MDIESEKEELSETSSKRLKESEWIVISSLWERGEVNLKDLSEKFGISEAALSQGLKRRGIKKGSKAHIAYKEIEAKSKEEREKLIEDIYKFKKRFIQYGDFLMNMAMNAITEAKKDKKPLITTKPDLDAIFAATKIYKTVRNDMFHLYDLYNPDTAPNEELEFNIGVYSQEELEDLKEAQELYAKEWNNLNKGDDKDEVTEEGE